MKKRDLEADLADLAALLKVAVARRGLWRVNDLLGVAPFDMSLVRASWLLRLHGEKLRELAELSRFIYYPAVYHASGSGPFGRYSNNRAKYHRAAILIEKGDQ